MPSSRVSKLIELKVETDEAMDDLWELYNIVHKKSRFPISLPTSNTALCMVDWVARQLPMFDSKHPLGFTRITDRDILTVVGWLIAQWVSDRSLETSPIENTFLSGHSIEQRIRSEFGAHRPELMSIRIVSEGFDSHLIYHRHAILMGTDDHFATIHVKRDVTFQYACTVRRAFWCSILYQKRIYVDDNNSVPASMANDKFAYEIVENVYFKGKRDPHDD